MRLAYSHLDNVNYTTVQWYGGVDTVIISRIHRAQTFLGDETQAFRKTMLYIVTPFQSGEKDGSVFHQHIN